MNSDSAKEKIREQVPIIDVISRYVELLPAGSRLKGLSPFTGEKTPSFYVDPEKNLFYCFSSQQGGDIFSFIQIVEGFSFPESIRFLAKEYAIDISDTSTIHRSETNTLYEICEDAITFFRKNMTNEITTYMKQRDVKQESLDLWEIGYAPSGWSALTTYLQKKGYQSDVLKRSGLVGIKGEKIYDRFRDRIMFPLKTQKKCVGFTGRASSTNEESGKYINVPETEIYKKKSYCYGLDQASQSIRKNNFVILVEGQMDVILMHQYGFTTTVASSGTAVTQEHIRAIARYTKNIVLAFDGDTAGVAAAIRATEQAFAVGMEVRVALCPDGKDPADIVSENKDIMRQIIANAKPAVECFIDCISKDNPREEIYKTLFPLISSITDSIQKDIEINRIAKKFEISPESIRLAYEKSTNPTKKLLKKIQNDIPTKRIMNKHCHTALNAYTYLKNHNEDTSKHEENIKEVQEIPTMSQYVYTGDLQFEEMFKNEKERVNAVKDCLRDSLKEFLKVFCNACITALAKKLDDPHLSKEQREEYSKKHKHYLAKLQSVVQ